MSSTRAGGAEQDGGPAFPTTALTADKDGTVAIVRLVGGMSLRDYFAAKALPQVMAASDIQNVLSWEAWSARVAIASYEVADAMLRARASSPAPSPSEPLSPAETMRAHIDTFGEKP